MTSFPFTPFPFSISSHDPLKFLAPSSLISAHKHIKNNPTKVILMSRPFWILRASFSIKELCCGDKCIVQVLLDLAVRDFSCYFWAPGSPEYHWASSKPRNRQQLISPSWLPAHTLDHMTAECREAFAWVCHLLPMSSLACSPSSWAQSQHLILPSNSVLPSDKGGGTESTFIGWAHW